MQEQKEASKEDIANASIAQAPVADLNYAPGTDLSNEAAIAARKELQERIGRDTLGSIQDKSISSKELEDRARDHSIVVPVAGLKANAMWLPYPAVQLGMAETLVNKAHSWVAEAYLAAERHPRLTLILHQLFTILARAELEVRSTPWNDVPGPAVEKTLERFRRKASAIGEDLAETLTAELRKLESDQEDEE